MSKEIDSIKAVYDANLAVFATGYLNGQFGAIDNEVWRSLSLETRTHIFGAVARPCALDSYATLRPLMSNVDFTALTHALAKEASEKEARGSEIEAMKQEVLRVAHHGNRTTYATGVITPVNLAAGIGRQWTAGEMDLLAKKHRPPGGAEKLLKIVIPRDQREALLGDLEEQFRRTCERDGHRFACWQYKRDALDAAVRYVIRLGEKLFKWGVIGWVIERLSRGGS